MDWIHFCYILFYFTTIFFLPVRKSGEFEKSRKTFFELFLNNIFWITFLETQKMWRIDEKHFFWKFRKNNRTQPWDFFHGYFDESSKNRAGNNIFTKRKFCRLILPSCFFLWKILKFGIFVFCLKNGKK